MPDYRTLLNEVNSLIQIKIELEDVDNGFVLEDITLPGNLHGYLDKQCEYIITDCEPYIPGLDRMSVWDANEVLNDINFANPGMTGEFLSALAEASSLNLLSKKFLERVKENDFLFEDLSGLTWKMDAEEKAACYIAENYKIPFDDAVSKEMLKLMVSDELVDYIAWGEIWEQYELMGFRVIEEVDENSKYKVYLIHWKQT